MSCNNLGDIDPCELKGNPLHHMENAGLNVGIDLEKPIDCSQMEIYMISSESVVSDFGRMEVKRTTILHAYVFNDKGEREELTITFELLSQKMPKLIRKGS